MSTDRPTFADGLRALADLYDAHPDLPRPFLHASALHPEDLDRAAAAFAASGVTYTDRTSDHDRTVTAELPGCWLSVVKVHDAAMRRYLAGQDFIREHAAEIAERAAAGAA